MSDTPRADESIEVKYDLHHVLGYEIERLNAELRAYKELDLELEAKAGCDITAMPDIILSLREELACAKAQAERNLEEAKEKSLELTRRNVEFTRTLELEAAALKAKVDRYEKALSKIIAEPNESLSDSKCVRFMVEYAKKAMKGGV